MRGGASCGRRGDWPNAEPVSGLAPTEPLKGVRREARGCYQPAYGVGFLLGFFLLLFLAPLLYGVSKSGFEDVGGD